MEELYLEEVNTYYYRGDLPDLLDALMKKLDGHGRFEKNLVYSPELFREHLNYVSEVEDPDNITSTVARCVEYGFREQLSLLLPQIDGWLLSKKINNGTHSLDKRLLLRKIDIPCYDLAKEYGFSDPELEKRVTLMKTKWLLRKGKKVQGAEDEDYVLGTFEGPTPQEYMGEDLKGGRYWGYRQILYMLRWNRRQRYRMLELIFNKFGTNCCYQAYIDLLEQSSSHGESILEHITVSDHYRSIRQQWLMN